MALPSFIAPPRSTLLRYTGSESPDTADTHAAISGSAKRVCSFLVAISAAKNTNPKIINTPVVINYAPSHILLKYIFALFPKNPSFSKILAFLSYYK